MYWEDKVIIPSFGNKGVQEVLAFDPVINLIIFSVV
jgi:hypothetical protein